MSEPATATIGGAGILAFSVALLGPMAGEYAVIVISALAGALWALSRQSTATRRDGALMIFKLVLTACVLTGGAVWWLESEYDVPAHHALAPVAFCIGCFGDRWPKLLDELWQRLMRKGADS